MSLRFRHLPALVLAGAMALSACSDSTSPSFEGNFDAAGTSSNLQTIEEAFATAAFQSFAALGSEFGVGGGVPAASAALLQTASSETMSGQAAIIAQQIASAVAAPAAILIPYEYRGQTYTFNGQYYEHNPDRTDADTAGVRFILYAVNPVTGEIAEPLNEIGYVDLIDESTDTQAAVRLTVASGETTYLDYAVSAIGPPTAPTFTIDGFITDGENRADFTLSASAVITFAGATLNLSYEITVGENFAISATLGLMTDVEENVTITVDVSVTHYTHTVSVAGTINNDLGVLEVSTHEGLFATITVTDSSVTVLGADGQPLDQAELNALRELVDMFDDIFDTWEHLFHPVEFLFEGPQS